MEEKSVKTPQPMSYEELRDVCQQLSTQAFQLEKQNKELRNALNAVNYDVLFKKADFMFAIINSESAYISDEFKRFCTTTLESMFKPKEETTE